MDLIDMGTKGRVPLCRACRVPLLVTLLSEDPHKFLGVPNQERHLSVDKEVPSCFGSY